MICPQVAISADNVGAPFAVTLLATKLPAASTFFLTYFVLTSLHRYELGTELLTARGAAGHHCPRWRIRRALANRDAHPLLRQVQ